MSGLQNCVPGWRYLDDGVGPPHVLDGQPGVPRRPLALNERRDLRDWI